MIKKLSLFIVLLVLCTDGRSDPTDSAVAFMQTLGNQVIGVTKTKQGEEKRKALKEVFEHNVHYKSIARFVLGKARRALKFVFKEAENLEQEKENLIKEIHKALDEFDTAYKKSVVRIYLSSFDRDYKEEVFQATHAKKDGEDGAIVYSTLDRKNDAPPLNLHWVLKTTESGWQIVDLRVEGVSQAEKERDETASIIQKHKNECKDSGGKFCDLVALKKLTEDHRALNDEWKKKVRSEVLNIS